LLHTATKIHQNIIAADMSRPATRRLLASSPFSARFDTPCTYRPALQCLRSRQFSHTPGQLAAGDEGRTLHHKNTTTSPKWIRSVPPTPSPRERMNMDALTELFSNNKSIRSDKNGNYDDMGKITNGMAEERLEDPHHFHIYATKHNTHITLTKPNRDPLISVSCGNIGFRKAGRKHYDSAFQLAAYVIGRIQEQGLNPQSKGRLSKSQTLQD